MKHTSTIRTSITAARDYRDVSINSAIGSMIHKDRTIAIKLLNFLEENPINGYTQLKSNLPKLLTDVELKKQSVLELVAICHDTYENVQHEIQHVKSRIRDLRMEEVNTIDSTITGLNARKAELVKKIEAKSEMNEKQNTTSISEPLTISISETGTDNTLSLETETKTIPLPPGSELAIMNLELLSTGDDVAGPLLVLPLHNKIPTLRPVPPQFGTIGQLRTTGGEISPSVEKNLIIAQEMLPEAYDFNELTPQQLEKMVKDMQLFISPESMKQNIGEVYDYVASMRGKLGYNVSDVDMKKFKRMTENRVFSDENTKFALETIFTVFSNILSDGIGMVHLLERNIGTTTDTISTFLSDMKKPFISNGIPADYREQASQRAKNTLSLLCLMRVLDRGQEIYTQRLKEIVPYYQSTTTEILRFYAELELKLKLHSTTLLGYFTKEEQRQILRNIAFIRSVDGNMEQFGRISPKQEQSLKETVFMLQQSIQSRIDAYADFESIVSEEYIRPVGSVGSAYYEIYTRLYDRGDSARTTRIGNSGALRFPKIDQFVAFVTNKNKATFISEGHEAVRMCIENPKLLLEKQCPPSLGKIINLYLPHSQA